MFHLSPGSDTSGVTEADEIEVAPALVVRRFGSPARGDGSKVSGEYVFLNLNGDLFVLHDWKSTSLWDQSFPHPDEFWAGDEPAELRISTRDQDAEEFKTWFLQQLREVENC
jgi:hypothetical protein